MSHLSCLNLNKSTVGFDLFQCSPRNKCFACWERIAHAKIEARAIIKRGGEGRGGEGRGPCSRPNFRAGKKREFALYGIAG